ncbi:MAG: accessory factor UbiK family protein [Zoogloeaceae bacterium]|jgi:BMFP domain-containing protein YqiC|nr:accessory factor UbiK family protein [Zoogloeaceae bacterium]
MFDPKTLEAFGERLSAAIAASPVRDVEKNARALATSFFSRLDLVTREEFEIQAGVLAATREKLTALEARVAELEKAASSATQV